MKLFILAFLLLTHGIAFGADTLIMPGTTANPSGGKSFYLQTAGSKVVPAMVVYTTDGNGNLAPIGSSTVNLGTITQGNPGTAPNAWFVREAGHSSVALVRNDYTSTNVLTSAYVQLVASTTDIINKIYVTDSSAQTLKIAVGAAASEVDQFYIAPNFTGVIDLYIPASSRISIKSVSATANTGQLLLSLIK